MGITSSVEKQLTPPVAVSMYFRHNRVFLILGEIYGSAIEFYRTNNPARRRMSQACTLAQTLL